MKIEDLQQVLTKEMSRKEFFQHVGIFLIGAVGITALLSNFSKTFHYQPKQSSSPLQTSGYGTRPYGE